MEDNPKGKDVPPNPKNKEVPSLPRDEIAVIKMVTQYLKRWNLLITVYNFGIYALGIISISTSLFVAGFVGATIINKNNITVPTIDPLYMKICAIASSVSLTFLTAFNVVNKSNDTRRAWRTLNAAYLFYQSGAIDLNRLISEYYTAEQIIGTVDFNFNSTQQPNNREPLEAQPKESTDAHQNTGKKGRRTSKP